MDPASLSSSSSSIPPTRFAKSAIKKSSQPEKKTLDRSSSKINNDSIDYDSQAPFSKINPVRNSRAVLQTPQKWFQAVTHAAERRGISNGINYQVSPVFGLIVTAAVSIFFAAIMLYLSNAPMATSIASVTSFQSRNRLYTSEKYGYQVRYPNSWTYQTLPSVSPGVLEEIIFSRATDKIVILTTREISTNTLFPEAPLEFAVRGGLAARYHDYDKITGQSLDRVVIGREDGTYQELRGYGRFFDQIVNSFTILDKTDNSIQPLAPVTGG